MREGNSEGINGNFSVDGWLSTSNAVGTMHEATRSELQTVRWSLTC
ncbi:hypothetical protein THTE_1112 [Thermogutta terrifontis]|uniref:Uncharacterized protein n=1 Tax=Thermogutta terrifontis TaxID=1331910 RepID=A0A286RCM2_9BACT|nr:hypothetical protein THTE_1112 [Thermogutta terrifontis]